MHVHFQKMRSAKATIRQKMTDSQNPGGGGVWCNPPYGREISSWVKKAYEESQKEYNSFVLMLLPARTDTKWWWDWVQGKATLFFIKGRVKFGDHNVGAPFPSVLALYMKEVKG